MSTSEKSGKNGNKKIDEPRAPVRNAADLQRLKLEKLMKNPEKEVIIPERPKEKKLPPAPEFIRNVMGSSAGAGSGEFHVYRHLRRKEYSRQKFIQEQKEKAKLDEEYQQKILENQKALEERTAKKREKRLKKMAKYKAAKKKKKLEGKDKTVDESKDDEESDDEGGNEVDVQKTDQSDDCSGQGETGGPQSQEDSSNDPHEQLDYSDEESK